LLVPSYLDGELSEEQAGPLRRHLLDCPACRELAQGGQALKRWFVQETPIAVPSGFAARVARRAFAGDAGVLPDVAPVSASEESAAILPFVLRMTAIAAAVLFVFALAIRQQRLPEDADLSAEEPWQDVRQALIELNEREAAAAIDAKVAADEKVETDEE
jgi:anti-sigma factor RsiW